MDYYEELRGLGVDVEEGMHRMLGNESLYRRTLAKFPGLLADLALDASEFDCEDYDEIIRKTHAVKGAAGNLSLTPIYGAYAQMVDLLRQGRAGEAREIFERTQSLQAEIIRCIERHQ